MPRDSTIQDLRIVIDFNSVDVQTTITLYVNNAPTALNAVIQPFDMAPVNGNGAVVDVFDGDSISVFAEAAPSGQGVLPLVVSYAVK